MDISPAENRMYPDLSLGRDLQTVYDKLTDKQRNFVHEYLVDLNGTQSAIRAGYPKKSAHITASNLLRHAKVWAILEYALDLRAERCSRTAEDVEGEYWSLYREARSCGNHSVARACLKDLGEYLSMFIRMTANVDGPELTERLKAGRQRMNRNHPMMAKAHKRGEKGNGSAH